MVTENRADSLTWVGLISMKEFRLCYCDASLSSRLLITLKIKSTCIFEILRKLLKSHLHATFTTNKCSIYDQLNISLSLVLRIVILVCYDIVWYNWRGPLINSALVNRKAFVDYISYDRWLMIMIYHQIV